MFLKTQNSRLRQGYGGQAKLKTIAAFTLVELIIYTAIFSIVSITMTSLLVSITKVGDRTNSASEVSSQLNFVMQNIQRLVKNASNIDIQSGVSTSTLVLRMQDSAKDPTVISLTSSTIFLKEGSGATTTLTSDKVIVNALNFKKISQYPGHDIVYIDLTITNNNTNPSSQLTRSLSSAIARVSAATFDSGLVPGTGSNYDIGTTGSPWRNGYFSGVVGIGTVTPVFRLQIEDTLGAHLRLSRAGQYYSNYLTSDGRLIWADETNDRVTFDGSGNVGIGTTTPSKKLQVYGGQFQVMADDSQAVPNDITMSGTTNSNQQLIMGYNTASDYGSIQAILQGSGSKPLALNPSGGNVGIGTTTPGTAKLMVAGATSGQLYTSVLNTGTGVAFSTWGNGPASALAGVEESTTNHVFYGTIPYAAVFGNQSSGYATQFAASNTVAMTIAPSGNVGIGPVGELGSKLNINYPANNGATKLSWQSGGGLLVTNPSYANGGEVAKIILNTANGGYNNGAIIHVEGAGNYNAGQLVFSTGWDSSTNATERMRINSTGVGIGKTPSYPLDVNGIVRASSLVGSYGPSLGGNGAGLYTAAGNMIIYFDNSGNSHRWDNEAVVKTFIIQHPLDENKYLVHGTLEGPEAAVFYRGDAKLKNGMAKITLPSYFEALTRKEGMTISLTNIDGFDRLAVRKINGAEVSGGEFTVYSDNKKSNQEFNWEVKAVRGDVPTLVVEPDKADINIYGDGPYTYSAPKINQ